MTMSPRRLLRCGLVFAALTMVGCDLDELNHGCEVLYEIHWDQKIQSMHFVHEDPSKCPIPIPEADGNAYAEPEGSYLAATGLEIPDLEVLAELRQTGTTGPPWSSITSTSMEEQGIRPRQP